MRLGTREHVTTVAPTMLPFATLLHHSPPIPAHSAYPGPAVPATRQQQSLRPTWRTDMFGECEACDWREIHGLCDRTSCRRINSNPSYRGRTTVPALARNTQTAPNMRRLVPFRTAYSLSSHRTALDLTNARVLRMLGCPFRTRYYLTINLQTQGDRILT